MTRLFLLAPLALAACQMEGAPAGAPRMDQQGTCFLYVEDEGAGKYTVVSGVGDGSPVPKAMIKRGLSGAQADALWTKERKIMDINPECLRILATDRTQARPAKS
ncbi:MAG: hypothetical protein H5U24_16235 [Thioclava marina]|jgi:hypothetical protein|uniref:Lipoprotein n=1 Tax=Thioclava marina TaxID=1915077 RepID=A0ABX3MNA2_9RHOB|nr:MULTISPECIES: hypothetical protein [Thioclava]MBC7146930.1 hypothetical protein [Thioclava marina]MBD3804686.1 hypothetical protein [Thioclava sp.]OOY12887.1 hypothetical protein BMG00_03450 [Thioclava marina]TNF15423.1 MAG: hypothetical protein EP320_04510 [Paracoccaceae bacterium]